MSWSWQSSTEKSLDSPCFERDFFLSSWKNDIILNLNWSSHIWRCQDFGSSGHQLVDSTSLLGQKEAMHMTWGPLDKHVQLIICFGVSFMRSFGLPLFLDNTHMETVVLLHLACWFSGTCRFAFILLMGVTSVATGTVFSRPMKNAMLLDRSLFDLSGRTRWGLVIRATWRSKSELWLKVLQEKPPFGGFAIFSSDSVPDVPDVGHGHATLLQALECTHIQKTSPTPIPSAGTWSNDP